MRPAGDVAGHRPRKDLENANQGVLPSNRALTSFFIASEDMLGSKSSEAAGELSDTTFGIESLPDAIHGEESQGNSDKVGGTNLESRKSESRRYSIPKPVICDQEDSSESSKIVSQMQTKGASPPRSNYRHIPPSGVSESLISLSHTSQLQNLSLPDSPKSNSTRSFRPSDEESLDEIASQAIVSSGEDENDYSVEIQDSSPQLIMPSIKMPSRRPFTDRGKGMGRLKIMIAGDSGIGKTSLIKSFVQICEDIVHIDALIPHLPSVDQVLTHKSHGKREKPNANSTDQITEVYASTRAYPSWWSDIEESRVFRRRKSMGDTILERNLCFVDTPGYSHSSSPEEGINLVMNYVTEQMNKMSSFQDIGSSELISMLSGKGGTQVDVVFYLIACDIKPIDLNFMKRLSTFTNVIPLIAKADSLSSDDAQALKCSITTDLRAADIKVFLFNSNESTTSPPFTICSVASSDNENMDASLLMSPDYVQPLIPSELAILAQLVFDKENVSWLRHLAAKKLVYSQRESGAPSLLANTLNSPTKPNFDQKTFSSYSGLPRTSSNSSQAIMSYSSSPSSYLQARLADHTQREEKLAQIRLAKWSGHLQKCLQNERARYEAISRGERAVWLTQRLRECVDDGSLVPIRGLSVDGQSDKETILTKSQLKNISATYGYMNSRDPIGLLKWSEALRKRGWIAFQVVGGFGVLGAMAIWIVKSLNNGSDAYMSWTWERLAGKV